MSLSSAPFEDFDRAGRFDDESEEEDDEEEEDEEEDDEEEEEDVSFLLREGKEIFF